MPTLTPLQFAALVKTADILKQGNEVVTKHDINNSGAQLQDLRRKGMVKAVQGTRKGMLSGYVITPKGYKALKNPKISRVVVKRKRSCTDGTCSVCKKKRPVVLFKKHYRCKECLLAGDRKPTIEDFVYRRVSRESDYDRPIAYGEAN